MKITNVQKARARLLLASPFFGSVIVSTPMIERSDIPTAATDMRNIYYNASWFADMEMDKIVGVLAHEVLHIVLQHGLRRQNRHPVLWNIACDHAINLMLLDCGFKLPPGQHDPRFKGMSAEAIYAILVKEQPTPPKPKKMPSSADLTGKPPKGKPSDGDSSGGDDEGDEDGSGEGAGDEGGDGGDPVHGLIGTDLIEPDMSDPLETAKLRDDIRGKVVQAATMARLAGKMPAGLDRVITDLIYPPVDWVDVLRPLMTRMVREDESWSRRNRRFSDVYLPARWSNKIGTGVIIGDTSGSITNEDMKSIGGTVVDVIETVTPEKLHVLWADKVVAGEQEFDCGDDVKLVPKGGGGTDMRVPLARAAELEADFVILISDGHTPWPDVEPDYPLIVLCTTDVDVPIGEVIRI